MQPRHHRRRFDEKPFGFGRYVERRSGLFAAIAGGRPRNGTPQFDFKFVYAKAEFKLRGKNDEGILTGFITLNHLKEALIMSDWYESLLAMDIMEPAPVVCSPEMAIPDLYEVFTKNDCDAIAIADADNKAMGVIEKAAIDHFCISRLSRCIKIASLG